MDIRGLLSLAVSGSLTVGLFTGCMESLGKQVKKDPNSIIGKKTDDIEEFDPNAAKQVVSDSKVKVDDPVLYAMQAYGPMIEQISTMYIDHALDLFNATEGPLSKGLQRVHDPHHQREPDQAARAPRRCEVRLRRREAQAADRQSHGHGPECRPRPGEELVAFLCVCRKATALTRIAGRPASRRARFLEVERCPGVGGLRRHLAGKWLGRHERRPHAVRRPVATGD